MKDICEKIDEKSFTNAVSSLNLTKITLNNETTLVNEGQATNGEQANLASNMSSAVSIMNLLKLIQKTFFSYFFVQYLMDSMCQPQSANKNQLAESAIELYNSGKFADIEFVIINTSQTSMNDCDTLSAMNSSSIEIKYSIRVHGVIVASRCMWFKRALSSGMKEAIDK